MQFNKKVVLNQPIIEKAINHIKGALIIILKDLKKQLKDWRSKRCILVLVNQVIIQRVINQRFKLKDKDKLKVNLWY